jgi:amino acid transporter
VSQAFFPIGCAIPEEARTLLAATAICFVTFLNCYDVRGTAKLQNIFLFAKITPLVFIILAGVLTLSFGNFENVSNITFEGTTTSPGNVSFALYYGSFAYAGWQALYSVTEELKNPSK